MYLCHLSDATYAPTSFCKTYCALWISTVYIYIYIIYIYTYTVEVHNEPYVLQKLRGAYVILQR